MAASFGPSRNKRRATFGGRGDLKAALDTREARAKTPLATVGEAVFAGDEALQLREGEEVAVRASAGSASFLGARLPINVRNSADQHSTKSAVSASRRASGGEAQAASATTRADRAPEVPPTGVTAVTARKDEAENRQSIGAAVPQPAAAVEDGDGTRLDGALGGFWGVLSNSNSHSSLEDSGPGARATGPAAAELATREAKFPPSTDSLPHSLVTGSSAGDLSTDGGVGALLDFRPPPRVSAPATEARRSSSCSSKATEPGSSVPGDPLRISAAVSPEAPTAAAPPVSARPVHLAPPPPTLNETPKAGFPPSACEPLLGNSLNPRRIAAMTPSVSETAGEPVLPSLFVHSVQKTSQAAADKLYSSLGYFHDCVQQGPEGVRALGFAGGVVMFVYSVLCLVNVFRVIIDPLQYFLDTSFAFAGLLIVIWEASDDLLRDWRVLLIYQTKIAEYMKFLVVPWCLGLFYLYVGTLQLLLHVSYSVNCLLGMWWVIMGALNLALHFGYDVSAPTRMLGDKMQGGAQFLKEKINLLRGKEFDKEEGPKFVRIRNS